MRHRRRAARAVGGSLGLCHEGQLAPADLRRVYAAGLMLECVSQGELEHAFASVPGLEAERVLVHAQFRAAQRIRIRLRAGVRVTLDNCIRSRCGRKCFAAGDLSAHRSRVSAAATTARAHRRRALEIRRAAREADELVAVRRTGAGCVTGLHAHTGSGIFDVANWTETGERCSRLGAALPRRARGRLGRRHRRAGTGVRRRSIWPLARRRDTQARFRTFEFWMEPGRFLVAKAGRAGGGGDPVEGQGRRAVRRHRHGHELSHQAGAVRRASRHPQPDAARRAASQRVNVVGSDLRNADQLGTDRWLPPTQEGDVLLIATCGAYGYAMASNYNLRAPAREFMIES
jgi:diaminopimelate decarboxylase/aspartate kinase